MSAQCMKRTYTYTYVFNIVNLIGIYNHGTSTKVDDCVLKSQK